MRREWLKERELKAMDFMRVGTEKRERKRK